jgi:pimeloyl-ACP methyl ester carboxylesterase
MRKILFLPGAGGSPEFWQPIAKLLPDEWDKVFFGWPGLGDQPHDPKINSIDDLVRLVEVKIGGPVDLVAQSTGGVIAARTALNRSTAVRRLVLAVTSAGLNMAQFGAEILKSLQGKLGGFSPLKGTQFSMGRRCPFG